MLDAGTIRGAHGLVKSTYLTAAVITGFVVARDTLTGAWMVRGTASACDAYLLNQPPHVFVIPHKGGAWQWPIESLRINAPHFEARLGALQ
jgi:hypothetical protein